MRIYVGNLSYDLTSEELRTPFAAFGKVNPATVLSDNETGRSRGFGFVEMPTISEAQAAIAALNGKGLKGRSITVAEARARSGERGWRG